MGDLGQKYVLLCWLKFSLNPESTKLSGLHLFIFIYTLLKIKVLQKVLHSDAIEEPFLVPQRIIKSKIIQRTISFLSPSHLVSFYNLENLFSPQRTFCETERFFRC